MFTKLSRLRGLHGYVILAGSLLAAGCGSGTVALLNNSDNGGNDPPPTLTAFEVMNPKVSPANLHFESSESVVAELFFALPGEDEEPMMELDGPGVSGNQVQLPAGTSELTWNFALEAALGGPEFEPDVSLVVRHPNGAVISGGELHLGIGNDPPVMLEVDPQPTDPQDPTESSGNVDVRLKVSDSSSDVVTLKVEWRHASDAPDAWMLATSAGVFPQGIETRPDEGVALSFSWATNEDLQDGDDDVVLRVTPDDRTLDADGLPVGEGEPLESRTFHIDNNEEPIVQLLNDAVIANPDERRGIPVPCRVIDEEGDLVELILQWRREGEGFPALPSGEAELGALLADPVQRREKHVCTPYPHFAAGLVTPVDVTSVRLPELGAREAWALAMGLEGQTLELLRSSSIPAPITPTWSANPLVEPVAALPLGDGRTALVLDGLGGSWRLREIELATGAVKLNAGSILASGPGVPSAMALERGERAVLIASDLAGTWRLQRVELASGALTQIALSDGSEPGPVRGIASRGTTTALFTVGANLFQIDYGDPLSPRLASLLCGLAAPSGVVLDPREPDRCYLSEREANRVLAVELDTRDRAPVVVKTTGGGPGELVEPGALAFEGTGRLLVVTAAPGGGEQLMGLDLANGNVAYSIGPPRASGIASVASGPDGLRLATVPGEHELLVAGGLEQRRTILALDPQSPSVPREQLVVVDLPFDPAPRPNQPWRIPLGTLVHASPEGVVARFVWDSADARSGPVILRAFARDDERGPLSEAAATKMVRNALEVEPLLLGAPGSVAVGDVDGDGDVDLVSNDAQGELALFVQDEPGIFRSPPVPLGGGLLPEQRGLVELGDLDGDLDLDIAVVAGFAPPTLFLLFQESPGNFGAPQPLPGSIGGFALGDLDGDCDQDILASTDQGAAILFQDAPGVFGSPQTFFATAPYFVPVVGDLDGDGDQDAVAMLLDGPRIFYQDPSGVFTTQQTLALPRPLSASGGGVAVRDLDGDGDQDILASLDLETIYFQTSPGIYAPTELSLRGGFFTGQEIGDLDGDGDQDILWNGLETSVLYQSSPGSFSDDPVVLALDQKFPIALSDLNGDGAEDIVAYSNNSDSDQWHVYFQSVPGGFAPAEPIAQTRSRDVSIGDMDGDGDQDLVMAETVPFPFFSTNDISIFFQGSTRSFAAPPRRLDGPGERKSQFTATGDLDGDGDLDIVSGTPLVDGLTVFLQAARGSFEEPILLGGPPSSAVAIGDVDCDGDADIVSANQLGLTVFRSEAPGAWTPFVLSLPNGAYSVAIGDIDGDGDQDIAAGAAYSTSSLAVFFHDCAAGFSAPLLLAGFAESIALGDLDGDGDQDIVTVTVSSGGGYADLLRVYFQGPAGRFDGPPLDLGGQPLTLRISDVAVADLDHDGDQDIVAVQGGGFTSPPGQAPSGLVAFYQSAPGTFGPGSVLADVGGPSDPFEYVEATDLDGDGELDIVSGVSLDAIFWGGR